jgi:hypothetical protein
MQLSRATFAARAAARPAAAQRAVLPLPARSSVRVVPKAQGGSGLDSEALAEKANEIAKDLKVRVGALWGDHGCRGAAAGPPTAFPPGGARWRYPPGRARTRP